ncbi:MAG TPA: hypothetical protein VFZ70_08870 [Euzebyales bacterium]
MRVKRSKARGRFDVTAAGRGMTGRSGTALLAETADRIGLTVGLSTAVGRCRSWHRHDPGKVVRDLVVLLADGGDALRHLAVLDGQPDLFGEVASPATANRTIVALARPVPGSRCACVSGAAGRPRVRCASAPTAFRPA